MMHVRLVVIGLLVTNSRLNLLVKQIYFGVCVCAFFVCTDNGVGGRNAHNTQTMNADSKSAMTNNVKRRINNITKLYKPVLYIITILS